MISHNVKRNDSGKNLAVQRFRFQVISVPMRLSSHVVLVLQQFRKLTGANVVRVIQMLMGFVVFAHYLGCFAKWSLPGNPRMGPQRIATTRIVNDMLKHCPEGKTFIFGQP